MTQSLGDQPPFCERKQALQLGNNGVSQVRADACTIINVSYIENYCNFKNLWTYLGSAYT